VVLKFDDSNVTLWDFEIKIGGSLRRCCFLRSAELPAIGISISKPADDLGRRGTPAQVH
jgi:hypothetical protein